MSKEALLKSISKDLALFEIKVLSSNDLYLYDKAKLAEDFYSFLLSCIYRSNFINMNSIKANFPAIDIGDLEKKLSVQITSGLNKAKYKKTVETFFEHKLNKSYSTLWILSIGDPEYEHEEIIEDVKIKTIKRSDLLKEISSLTDNELLMIRQFLDSDLYSNVAYSQEFQNRRLKIYLPQKILIKVEDESVFVSRLFQGHPLKGILNVDLNALLRNLIQELVENSIKHGNSTEVIVDILPTKIIICENGVPFSPKKLNFVENKRNGAQAFSEFFNIKFRHDSSIDYKVDRDNKLAFIHINFIGPLSTIKPFEDCVIYDDEIGRDDISVGCETIYVKYKGEQTRSKNMPILKRLEELAKKDKSYGVALHEDDRAHEPAIRHTYPNLKIKYIKS